MDMSYRWQFYPVVHAIMVLVHMGLSLVFILAAPSRFSSASWEPLRDLSPSGTVVPWGIALGISGILMAFGKLWSDIVGESLAICWFSFLAALFWVSLQEPNASATAFVIYTGMMAINGALVTQRVIDWTKRREYNRRMRG